MNILLIEDNPDDVQFAREGLRETGSHSILHVVNSGPDALAFLRREGSYRAAPCPDLILLDLNLPGMHGHEILRKIKEDPQLKRRPVVVLSSSANQDDIDDAYQAHANGYIVKPLSFDDYSTILGNLERFWEHTASKPS